MSIPTNPLSMFIKEKGLSEVAWRVCPLEKKDGEVIWSFVRILCNTTTNQSIYLKHFIKYDNFQITVNASEGKNNGYYISQTDKDGVVNEDFELSLQRFIEKGPSLEPRWAIEV